MRWGRIPSEQTFEACETRFSGVDPLGKSDGDELDELLDDNYWPPCQLCSYESSPSRADLIASGDGEYVERRIFGISFFAFPAGRDSWVGVCAGFGGRLGSKLGKIIALRSVSVYAEFGYPATAKVMTALLPCKPGQSVRSVRA